MGTIIHVRLRDGTDDDVAAWYEGQADKSKYVRDLIRADMAPMDPIAEAVARALESLPDMVDAAVRRAVGEVLASYQLTEQCASPPSVEDPALAARLDEQLNEFFEDV